MTIDIHQNHITGNPICNYFDVIFGNLIFKSQYNYEDSCLIKYHQDLVYFCSTTSCLIGIQDLVILFNNKLFNRYTGPGNPVQQQVDFNPYTGQIYKVNDPPSSKNDRCSMFHDIKYTVAENIGRDSKDIKNRKLDADKEWLDCFKPRTPYDMLAYSAIKSKKTHGLGNDFSMSDLSEELNKPVVNKFPRKKIIVNYIDEIHSCDLVDMQKYSRMNKGYKYIFTNIDIFSKYAWSFPIKSKKISDIKPCFEKILKKRKPKFIWSDKESSFFLKKC